MNDKCPDDDELLEYLNGLGSEGVAGKVTAHIDRCQRCEMWLREADAESADSLLRLLRHPPLKSEQFFLREAAYLEAVQRISTLPLTSHVGTRRQWDDSNRSAGDSVSIGDQVREYELLEVLGRGGMGVVYLARHSKLNRTVALKVISAKATGSPLAVRRFEREMETVGRLDHPGIVRAFDAGIADGLHFLVMEYVDGINLSNLIRRDGPLPVAAACRMVRDTAIALQHIDEHGLVHRDIKPGNIILDTMGEVRLLDLGLARLQQHPLGDPADLTATGELMGTVDYMSPEQADNTREVDIRADIYSLGATLFALLAGHAPFGECRHDSTMKKVAALATQDAPSIRRFRPEVSRSLAKVIARMLQRSPDARYQTPAEVAAALAPFCRADASGSTDTDGCRVRRMKTARSWLIGTLLLSGCVMLIVGGFRKRFPEVVTRNHSTPSTTPLATAEVPDVPLNTTAETPAPESLPPADLSLEDTAQRMIAQITVADPQHDGPPWDVFSADAPPDLRTQVIHTIALTEVPAEKLACRLRSEPSPSARSALLLTLGEFDKADVLAAEAGLDKYVLDVFQSDPDPGVHSAAEWLLDQWGLQYQRQQATNVMQQKLIPFDGGWYINSQDMTMVVFPAPISFTAGSPASESGRYQAAGLQDEGLRDVIINHTFAVAAEEVTREQFWRTREQFWKLPRPVHPGRSHHDPEYLKWDVVAEFCNDISRLEGIHQGNFCYVESTDPARATRYVEKPNALELSGYRMLTDDEWEYACRAGRSTVRHFGERDTWLHKYARCGLAEDQLPTAPGLLKPNAFGLFDMLGNLSEWCHDAYVTHEAVQVRRLRGGSTWTDASGVRSAARYGISVSARPMRMGICIGRTLRREPVGSPLGIQILVGASAEPNSRPDGGSQIFERLVYDQIVRLGTWNRGRTRERRFQLANTGTETVTVSLKHESVPFLNLNGDFPVTIPGGEAAEFGVRLADSMEGPRHTWLEFQLEAGSQQDELKIELAGNLWGPVFSLAEASQSAFDFGDLPVRGTGRHAFTIGNQGVEPLVAKVIQVTGPFLLQQDVNPLPMMHADWRSFEILVDAATTGDKRGSVVVTSNDGANTRVVLPLRARVVADTARFPICGVFSSGLWQLDKNRDGTLDTEFTFGQSGDVAVTGDLNSDGHCDIGVCRPNATGDLKWLIALASEDDTFDTDSPREFIFGKSGSQPVLADLNGDGRSDPGTVMLPVDRSGWEWSFDTDQDGRADRRFRFGDPHMKPVIGHWHADTPAQPGMVGPGADGTPLWRFSHSKTASPDGEVRMEVFGSNVDRPIVGDWDGDGLDNAGTVRTNKDGSTLDWYFNLDHDGLPEREFRSMGNSVDQPVVLSGRKSTAKDRMLENHSDEQ